MSQDLDGLDVLFIDGNNLLHRVAGNADPSALRSLIPRLRGAIPPTWNWLEADPECAIDCVPNVPRVARLRHVRATSDGPSR